jgi:uncharacterized membrane protein
VIITSLSWLQLALLAAIGFAVQTILSKVVLERGVSTVLFTTLIFTITSIVLWIYTFSAEKIVLPSKVDIITLLIVVSVITAASNLLSFRAIDTSKNPGYPAAVWSSSIVLVTFISLFVFKAPFDLIKTAGVIFIFIGIVFLSGVIKI